MIQPKDTKRFLEALFSGRLTEADNILNRLAKRHNTPEDMRYLKALDGLMYSYVNDDKEALIYRLYRSENLEDYRRRVLEDMRRLSNRPVVGDDPFFKAWVDVLELLDKVPHPHKIKQNQQQGQEEQP